jgi:hypothetical protein
MPGNPENNSHAQIVGSSHALSLRFFMNLVVFPLSAFPYKVSFPPILLITGLLVRMVFVGVPIALAAREASLPAQT